ncbi:MAG: TetR/AcrR family transcriptional regulator [Hyphomicrobiales bacterium]|nr:TetR/AcrR family transcriptional regulator [Hyphomicrobiales bacterium]
MKRGEKNRAGLVAAAARLFWHQGYDATSLADIARISDIPLGNVYYYFRSKSDFALAVADVFVAETELMLSEIEQGDGKPRERLSSLIARLARSLKSRVDHGCPIAFAVRDFSASAPAASRRAGESFSLLTGFIARELGRTGMRPSLALATARGAVAEWQGGMMLAFALKDATVLSESFRRMEQILL